MIWWYKKSLIVTLIGIFTMASLIFGSQSQAALYDNTFPKLANYYLGWDTNDQIISELAQWDLVIISSAAYTRNPEIVSKLRAQNRDITILVYVVSQEALTFAPQLEQGNFFREIYETVQANDWWLYKANAQTISTWPQANWINLTNYGTFVNGERFTDWLARRTAERFLMDNTFDGVLYDNMFDHVTWASKEMDPNRDGIVENEGAMNELWKSGVLNLIEKTKQYAPNKIVIGNTNSNYYNDKTNGRLLEHFPKPTEGGWTENLKRYITNGIGGNPKIFILNANNGNIPDPHLDLQKVRFTYTSSLLGDGFFSYTIGDQTHTSTWWYDEYSVHLGAALNSAKSIDGSVEIKPGIYRRDFANGTVFVNSSLQTRTVELNADYEKIKGLQAPGINDGAIVRKITLAPNDGIVLRRKISTEQGIINAVFENGTFVKAFNGRGESVNQNAFFMFDRSESGKELIARVDLENDGTLEKIVSDASKVIIYNHDNTVRATFYPYGGNYKSGINFDIGDTDNDGIKEIAVAPKQNFEPLVKVYDHQGREKNKGFHAYAKNFRGGVNIALANLNGSGKHDIVVGAGLNGGSQIRIFDGNGKLVSGGFFAYDPKFRGGAYVSAGDLNGNGKDEIIVGAGIGGSTHIRIFDGKTKLVGHFFAFEQDSRQGVKIFTADLDNDGKHEILAVSQNPF